MSWNSARHGASTVDRLLQRTRRHVANCALGKASTSLSCLRLQLDVTHQVGWLASEESDSALEDLSRTATFVTSRQMRARER